MPTERTWEAECLPQLFVFNDHGPVALCVLWTEVGKEPKPRHTPLMKRVPGLAALDKLSVAGNLRTAKGFGWFIRGLHKLPHVKLVLIWGEDLQDTGLALEDLWREGLIDRRLPKKGWEFDTLVPVGAVDELRRSVVVQNVRHLKAEELPDYIKQVAIPSVSSRESRDFPPVPLPELDTIPVEPLRFHFHEQDPGRAWLKILAALLQHAERRTTRKKEGIIHYVGVHATFPVPATDEPEKWFGILDADAAKYVGGILSPTRPEGVDYWYGERLQNWAGRNQLEEVIARLKKDRDTKRGSIAVLEPEDLETLEDAPCLTGITYAVVREGLAGIYKFRSHDMFGGWPNNALAMLKVHRHVASSLGAELGWMEVISENAQIYNWRLDDAKAWVEKQGFTFKRAGRFLGFRRDASGAFTFAIVRDEEKGRDVVQVEMENAEGDKVLWAARHPNPGFLIRWIVESMPMLDPQHVRYLGGEEEKLNRSLKTGEPYHQG
ncbi:MAG: hypothetical protein HYT39_00485 [Candidatus Sungbacteria bacterium]|nr:hypothetical protein [Candidatus Sungbacteria bacterium]